MGLGVKKVTATVNPPPPLSSGEEASASDLPTDHSDGGWGRAVFWPHGARWRGGMWFLIIFCVYAGFAFLYPFTETGGVALLWMPNAVLVTALLRFRPRDWPYVYAAGLVAEVAADLTFDVAPHQGLYFGFVNAIEATLVLLCAALIAGGRNNIGLLSVRGVAAVIIASVMVPALTGAIGAIGSVWTFGSDYFTAWRIWWFGDSLGLMVAIPVGLLLRDAVRSVALRRPTPVAIGGAGAATLMLVVSATLAASGIPWGAQQTALAAAVLLSLTFGAVGAPIAAAATATATLIGLAQGEGFGTTQQEQALLFVVFAAIYSIAATTESADRTLAQLSKARNQLAIQSRTDELTGLSNRRVLDENLELLWAWCVRESKPVAMLMVDVDCFHQYNATYGHLAGDSVLKRLAAVFQDAASRKTDLIIRYGGEEFLIVLPDANLDHAGKLANRIHQQVRDLNIENSSSFVDSMLTVSIGALAVPQAKHGSAIAGLERCDGLLYEAKHTGRNRTVAVQQ